MPAAITQQDNSRRRRRSGAATSQIGGGSQGSGGFSLSICSDTMFDREIDRREKAENGNEARVFSH